MFLDFYGLREQPFGMTPDPAYLWGSGTHTEALSSLYFGIKENRGFLALIAEPGMGKTTLLYELLEDLRVYARTVFVFQTQCDSREFFQYVLHELDVNTQGMGLVAMHSKLNQILFEEMLAGRHFVLVVDEAQNLDESVLETVRMLSNFELASFQAAADCPSWSAAIGRHARFTPTVAATPAHRRSEPSGTIQRIPNELVYRAPAAGGGLSR